MPGEAEGAGKRSQRVRIVVNEEEMSFSGQASVLCAASVAGCGQSFGRVLGRSGFFGGSRALARLPLRQLDLEAGAAAFVAGDADRSVVIADHRLHDGKTEAGAQLLGGVVRREQARAFFRREPIAVVRDLDADVPLALEG